VGLGGKIADAAIANNAYSLMSSIAVADDGTTGVFLAGDQAIPYQLTSAGAVHIDALDEGLLKGPMRAAFARMTQQPRAHLLENEYNRVMARAVAAESRVNAALNAVTLNTAFPSGSLAAKLKVVAKVIATRTAFDTRRQVFFVSLANFDLHDGLIARHPALLRQVNDALVAFFNATVELGVANQVTTFTASDFGRTLSSNGDGSDHGWGGHHFIVGGAVKGRAFYGTPPPLSISDSSAADDQWHVGQGRLLPSTSVDQYAATLARWFGVSEAEMPNVVPNLRRFGAASGRPDYPTDLGFMA
jgi:uncharacterized protein (DUF1501 family)